MQKYFRAAKLRVGASIRSASALSGPGSEGIGPKTPKTPKTPSLKRYDNADLTKEMADLRSTTNFILGEPESEREEMKMRTFLVLSRATTNCKAKIFALKTHHAAEISIFQQRSVIEHVFTDSLSAFNLEVLREKAASSSTPRVSALEETAKVHLARHNVLVNVMSKVPVSMTNINKLLLSEEIRKIVFPLIKMDAATPFPVFEKKLLFGYVSDILHNLGITTVYMSKEASESSKGFYKAVAARYELEAEEYDPAHAAMGARLFEGRDVYELPVSLEIGGGDDVVV